MQDSHLTNPPNSVIASGSFEKGRTLKCPETNLIYIVDGISDWQESLAKVELAENFILSFYNCTIQLPRFLVPVEENFDLTDKVELMIFWLDSQENLAFERKFILKTILFECIIEVKEILEVIDFSNDPINPKTYVSCNQFAKVLIRAERRCLFEPVSKNYETGKGVLLSLDNFDTVSVFNILKIF